MPRRALLALVAILAACGETSRDASAGGAAGTSGGSAGGSPSLGGSAGASPSCNPGEKCCGGKCLPVECRSNSERCACASKPILDGWMADAAVVDGCASSDAGVGCCMDTWSGTCSCTEDGGWCGWEGMPVSACKIPPCATSGVEGAACK